MLKIVIEVKRPPGQAIGIKEQIAMDLEKYGDVRVVSIEEVQPKEPTYEQLQLGDMRKRR